MPLETLFSERIKVKVTGVKLRSKWSYTELVRAIRCTFMHGFKIILHSCCPRGGKVPFEIFFQVG